jgi:hypothetical protein
MKSLLDGLHCDVSVCEFGESCGEGDWKLKDECLETSQRQSIKKVKRVGIEEERKEE